MDWDRLQEPCPLVAGTRVALVEMPNDPVPIPAGTWGTVVGGNGAQIWVEWDNGSRLALIVGIDKWRRV